MRRSVEIGYPRGEETRTRILNVALNLFGMKGFDAVSTREIAAAAAVPPPSLRYYFGDKQGLYVACLEHLQDSAMEFMEPALERAELVLKERHVDSELLIDAFCGIQEAMIDHLIGGPDDGAMAMFVIRHNLPSEAGEGKLKGQNRGANRMMSCFLEVIKRISGNTLDTNTALIIAGLVNGQLTAVQVNRFRLAEIDWTLTREHLRWLKRTIKKQTRAMLLVHVKQGAKAIA